LKGASLLFAVYGHVVNCGRSYATAIQYYSKALSLNPMDPMINLCLGICYIHRATQKTEKRHDHIIRGFTFLTKYREYRGDCPEVEYNFGRAFHQLELNNHAVHHYKKVLETDVYQQYSRQAAYNLSLIYISSGSIELAQTILRQHCNF
jgi:general transcription factor 3C polypeptide 3 (transcription factor C subunit 4)